MSADVTSYKQLPKGHCVFLLPTHVQSMISGVEKIQQNGAGLITLTYEGGAKKSVQMADFNLAEQTDFMAAFKRVWLRIETGA